MSKQYKCGLYVGRFQPIHLGHYNIIDSMLRSCEKVIIAVGSAQEWGTERNPFSYGLRSSLIFKSFGWAFPNVMVIPVSDRETPSNDPSWGDYLLYNVKFYTGITPDVIYEGEESERNHWYDNYDIPIVRVSRDQIRISSTDVRNALCDGNYDAVLRSTPFSVSNNYELLREELLKCVNYDSPKK